MTDSAYELGCYIGRNGNESLKILMKVAVITPYYKVKEDWLLAYPVITHTHYM